jgi:hypothetical protein
MTLLEELEEQLRYTVKAEQGDDDALLRECYEKTALLGLRLILAES